MRIPRIRLTYANIVSTMALFLALGGVSYAAVKLPANSVGEKQIKKNAVTGKKVKKNAITGDKIKPGTIKGTDITLSSLGKVPSAARADSAGTSDQVVTFSKRVNPTATGSSSQDGVRASATEVPLASNGPVSIYGKCYIYSGTLYADLLEKSTTDGTLSALYSYDYYYGSNGYLNANTAESDRQIYYTSASNNSYGYLSSPYYGQGTLFAADGNGLNFFVSVWSKQGNLTPYGNGAYGDGNTCIFSGSANRLLPN